MCFQFSNLREGERANTCHGHDFCWKSKTMFRIKKTVDEKFCNFHLLLSRHVMKNFSTLRYVVENIFRHKNCFEPGMMNFLERVERGSPNMENICWWVTDKPPRPIWLACIVKESF